MAHNYIHPASSDKVYLKQYQMIETLLELYNFVLERVVFRILCQISGLNIEHAI